MSTLRKRAEKCGVFLELLLGNSVSSITFSTLTVMDRRDYNDVMSKLARFARQIIAIIIGLPLLLIGIVLIPLPGPGVLICFIALLVLSWGFDWAKTYVEKCKDIFREIYRKAKERADRIEGKEKD